MKQAESVAEFVARLDHPLKSEIENVMGLIRSCAPELGERVKWNSPSFFLSANPKLDMLAIHLRNQQVVHLVFVYHNGKMAQERHGILEGDYPDRRMVMLPPGRFSSYATALEAVVRDWVALHAQ